MSIPADTQESSQGQEHQEAEQVHSLGRALVCICLQRSSNSAFTAHIKPNNWNLSVLPAEEVKAHRPVLENMVIMARESNNLKRKLLESICISSKAL